MIVPADFRKFVWLVALFLIATIVNAKGRQPNETTTLVCLGTNDTPALRLIISSFGTETGTIQLPFIPGSRCAVNNLTIPANVTLDNTSGTGIKVNTGQTLIITGPVVSPPRMFFFNALAGQGTVSFSGNTTQTSVHPEWWGAGAGVAASINASAFNAASAALVTIGSGEILLGPGTYDFDRQFTLGDDTVAFTSISLGGTSGMVGTKLRWTGASNGVALYCTRARSNRLHDFLLTNAVAKGTTVGIKLSGPATGTNNSGVVLERITVGGFHFGAIIGDGLNGGHDASEVTTVASIFLSNDVGLRVDGWNSVNVNLYATNFESNTTAGIDAYTGNVAVFGGAYGRNGVDWKQSNALSFTAIGVRSESFRVFDSQATSASAPVTLINIDQAVGGPESEITGASNAAPIEVTSPNHGLSSGQRVFIRAVRGNTAANGPWTVKVIGPNKFSLNDSRGNGPYSSGGLWYYDHNPVVIGPGTLATLEGCALKGSIQINSGFGGAAVTVRSGSTTFISPLDVTDGNGTLAHYTLEHVRRVDPAGVQIEMFNESGRVVGTALVPDSVSGSAKLSSGATYVSLRPRSNANYKISLSSDANEILRWANKTPTGFTIRSTNSASTASVDWRIEN